MIRFEEAGPVLALAYSPDGTKLLTTTEEETVRLWTLSSRRSMSIETLEPDDTAESVCFDAAGDNCYLGTALGNIHQVPLVGKSRKAHSVESDATGGEVGCLVHSGIKNYLVCGARDGGIGWFRADGLKRVLIPERENRSPVGLGLYGGGTLGLSVDGTGTLYRFDLSDRMKEETRPTRTFVSAMAISPADDWFAVATATGPIQIRDLQTLEIVRVLSGHPSAVYGLAFTPDGQRLLSGGIDRSTRIWDVASGAELHNFGWHSKWISCLAVAPDGLTAASGSQDGTIVVFDLP